MNGDEVVEFEFGYEAPFVAEIRETRQHFFYFFTIFSFASLFQAADAAELETSPRACAALWTVI
jgi:hypothetical protein